MMGKTARTSTPNTMGMAAKTTETGGQAPPATQTVSADLGATSGKKPGNRTGLALTKARYAEWVAAFRRFPPDRRLFKNVALVMKADPDHARVLWKQGWMDKPWAPPIRDIVLSDQKRNRQLMRHNENLPQHYPIEEPGVPKLTAQQEAEKRIAAEQRAQEARLVGTARGNVIALQAIIAQCLRGGLNLARQIEEHFKTGDISPREAFRIVNRLGDLVQQSSIASKSVLEAERLRVGLPSAIIGLTPAVDLTPEQLVAGVARGVNAIERAQRMGLVALPGGKLVEASSILDVHTVEEEGTEDDDPLAEDEPRERDIADDEALALDLLFGDD